MLAELRHIAECTREENIYLGDRHLREGLSRFQARTDDPPWMEYATTFIRGCGQLNLGQNLESVESLRRAVDLLPTLSESQRRENEVDSVFHLGIACLRLGEAQNCCQRNTPESCILPIQGDGIHTRPSGSRLAVKQFRQVLERSEPGTQRHLQALWLLNVAHMTLGDYPEAVPEPYRIPPEAFASGEAFPAFRNVAKAAGLGGLNLAGGAIGDDFDRDGTLDLVLSTFDTRAPLRYFRRGEKDTFVSCGEQAGLTGILGGLNVVHADYDNDGFDDLLVLRGGWLGSAGNHPNSLLRNNGDGTFTDVTFDSGLGERFLPTQTAAWADYDHDGDLDLYIGNEMYTGPVQSRRHIAPSQLFRNEGNETFIDVARSAGVANLGFAKGVVWGDYDNDGWCDLYVSNWFEENRLYHNNHDGTFTDLAHSLGVERPINGFPAWFWDYDNDGWLDLMANAAAGKSSEMAAHFLGLPFQCDVRRHYRNNGRGGFEDRTAAHGLDVPGLTMGCNFGDLDNDGFLDCYFGTGSPDFADLMPNLMYRNRKGDGFSNVTTAGRFGHLQKGHGVVFADFDQDGDQDVFEEMGGAYAGDTAANALYSNPGFGNRWIVVEIVGITTDRSALGVRLRLDIREGDQPRTVYKHVNSGGSFGGNPLRQMVGLGRAERIERLTVEWPTTGRSQQFTDVPLDTYLRIVEGAEAFQSLPYPPLPIGTGG